MGDGGGGNDTFHTAQDPDSLLGKMLRLDVGVPDVADAPLELRADAERGYRIPPGNPFVDGVPIAARAEIWAFGVRNPWRITLDTPALGGTGALLIGDVGQSAREEVDYEPAGLGGRNYGWPMREGTLTNAASPSGVSAAFLPLVDPIHDYPRADGISITGGYVYRGRLLGAGFQGRYVFGDLSNRLRSVRIAIDEGGAVTADDLRDHTSEVGGLTGSLVSIDTDAHGELYLVFLSGSILRVTTANDADRDGIDDDWARRFGLSGLGAAARGPFGDPDGDGVINAREYRRGSHPRGGPVATFGEGAEGFFATRIGLLNDRDTAEQVTLRFLRAGAGEISTEVVIPARRSLALDASTVPGLANQAFSTVLEAARPLAVTRTMTWPATGEAYGSHSERGIPMPRTSWYFAEGATTAFELFLLLGNPSTSTAHVQVDYLRQGAAAVSARTTSRPLTLHHLGEPGAGPRPRRTGRGGRVTERRGDHGGTRDVHTRRPGDVCGRTCRSRRARASDALGVCRGIHQRVLRDVPVDHQSRRRAVAGPGRGPPAGWFDPREAAAFHSRRAATRAGDRVAGPRGVRRGRRAGRPGWHLGRTDGRTRLRRGARNVVAGRLGQLVRSARLGRLQRSATPSWRLPGGEVSPARTGGEPDVETYVLIANVAPTDETVDVTVYFTHREPVAQAVQVPANSRVSVALSDLLGAAGAMPTAPAHVGVTVAAASPAAQLYAEEATYGSTTHQRWARGSNNKGSP